MSDFADNHITSRGEDVIQAGLAGETITFTRIVLGDGNLPPGISPTAVTDVASPRAEAQISKCELNEVGDAVVGARWDNEDQPEGFRWRELGVYARAGAGPEVLYSYGWTEDGEWIPAGGPTLVEKLIDVITYVGDGVHVDAVFAPEFDLGIELITNEEIDALWGATGGEGGSQPGISMLPMTDPEVDEIFRE